MSLFPPRDTVWEAVRRGDLEAVHKFVNRNGLPPNKERDLGLDSLLTVACGAGHADVVRFLLERGAVAIDSCYSPEAFAALRGGHLKVLRVLCEHGLDPDNKELSKHGDSLIDQAVEERRVEIVRLLLEQGGEIYTDYEDETTEEEYEKRQWPSPLELCARAGDVNFVKFLLEVGVDLKGQDGKYYLEKAQQNAPKFEQAMREKEEVEEEQRTAREVATQGGGWCLWGCLGLIFGPLALIGIFYGVAVWMGWEAVAFGCAFIGLIYMVMRMSRWGQA